MDNKFLLTLSEACTALGVGKTTAYKLIDAGTLKTVKIGKATRITVESVKAIASGEAVAGALKAGKS